jgi:hypothetical protein
MVTEDQLGNSISLKRKRNILLIYTTFHSLQSNHCIKTENEVEAEESALPAQTVIVKEDLSKSKREKKDSKNDDVMVKYICSLF